MPEEHYPTFKAQFEQELDFAESQLPAEVKKILLNEGHLSIWGYLEEQERFEDYEKLIDFYHTSEHLADAAEALFGKNKQTADPWYNKWYQKLLKEEQAPQQLLRSIEYYQGKQKLSPARLELLEKQKTFQGAANLRCGEPEAPRTRGAANPRPQESLPPKNRPPKNLPPRPPAVEYRRLWSIEGCGVLRGI